MKNTIPISNLLNGKSPDLWSISPDATVYDAISLMAAKNIGALLVMSGRTLAGILTERDYTRKVALHGKSSKETLISEIFSPHLVTVSPGDSIEECMRLMTEHRVRHLPILQNGEVIGIVSIGDLVNWIISAQNAAIEQLEQYIGGVAA